MQKRPVVKIKLSKTDFIFELCSLIILFSIWLLIIFNFKSLPEIIPVHFNAGGEADGFGSKWMIFSLVLIATLLFTGLTILNKFPHVFNYPVPITEENALIQYTYACRLIRYLKFAILLIFGEITYSTIQIAKGHQVGLGIWFTIMTIFLIFIPLTSYLILAFRKK